MEGVHESEPSSVYHAHDAQVNPAAVAEVVALGGGAARMFALVQEWGDEGEPVMREVVAYGMELPGGRAMTVSPSGSGLGCWRTPQSACRRLASDLVWLL
ncbi:hypothetical protein [Thermomonospora umbrina]|uniref:Uncharacterized protein n=1 Tax=Thermomonospora umbrina TaxID=111806 RepID=A0A3D9SS16_9ACTN|nr:hypothetical protein [Thermomonospora umbrina]REE98732.1 hypothetical protein DFJ69_4227 [Thermomonospora umbrina]